nr:unnamed protein product [Callosobruchus chinensis]
MELSSELSPSICKLVYLFLFQETLFQRLHPTVEHVASFSHTCGISAVTLYSVNKLTTLT